MWLRLILGLCISIIALTAHALPRKQGKTRRVQLAFLHFVDDHVRVTVNGKSVVDRAMRVEAGNERSGIAGYEQVEMPPCADIAVRTKHQRVARHVCLGATAKSITIDAGPPLTLVQHDYLQGVD